VSIKKSWRMELKASIKLLGARKSATVSGWTSYMLLNDANLSRVSHGNGKSRRAGRLLRRHYNADPSPGWP
jgi:hypothetical protein